MIMKKAIFTFSMCLLCCNGCTHTQTPSLAKVIESDSVSITKLLREDKKLIGFLLNPKVTAMQDCKIVLIADEGLFKKNGIDLAYRKEIVRQLEETNRGIKQWIEEGLVTKEQMLQNFIDAQKELGRKIKE